MFDSHYIEYELLNGDTFEYPIDEDEAEDYIKRTFDTEDILFDYTEEVYPYLSNSQKQEVEGFGYDGTFESVQNMEEYLKTDMVNDIIYLMIDKGVYDKELKDYFENEAQEYYNDIS